MTHFDLVVIGGGAAGQMAAISAMRHHPKCKVAIVDRTFALGRKILVCGAGRCNITNLNLNANPEQYYYCSHPELISNVFTEFGYESIVQFFNDLGIELYVERKTDIGKLFPTTNQAHTVTTLLVDELERCGTDIFLNHEVSELKASDSGFVLNLIQTERGEQPGASMDIAADKVILSAGGKTYPALGSNGTGYNLAESLRHYIIEPVPSALPLEAKNSLSQLLQGQKLELEVTSIISDQPIKTRTDEVMFTQYGLSGPAILNISRELSIHFNREQKSDGAVRLNFFPGKSADELRKLLTNRWQRRPDQKLRFSLYGLLPNKVVDALLQILELPGDQTVQLLKQDSIDLLINKLTAYAIKVSGTRGWNEAEFTAGGIDTAEVDPVTLESKIQPGLFFAGEILDVDGDVGGFNLSWAWCSGYVAGKLGK